MPQTISPLAFPPIPSVTVSTSNAVETPNGLTALDGLSRQDREHLEDVLKLKLSGIPTGHLPSLRLSDVLQQTPRTRLTHIPSDIDLAWFLRNRARVDEYIRTYMQNKSGGDDVADVDEKVVRAAWYYRLSASHQFQRYHDAVRWNLAIYTALLTQHSLLLKSLSNENTKTNSSKTSNKLELSPAALRFITSYLSAVLEQHNAPAQFEKRNAFIALWQTGRFDLFTIHKSWAKKALQRALKALSSEWAISLSHAQRAMGSEHEDDVGRFAGSLVPGREDRTLTSWARGEQPRGENYAGRGAGRDVCYDCCGTERDTDVQIQGEANELLDALCAPLSLSLAGQRAREPVRDEMTMVCDMRTAVTCVQTTRPRDMLPVLMRLFPVDKHEA